MQVLSNSSADIVLNTSTDNDSLNLTDSSTHIIDPDSLLMPLRVPKPKPKNPNKPRKLITQHILPPFIKIKQESLSDSEIDPEPIRRPIYVGESRNVARRSKKLVKKSPTSIENHTSNSIDNMSIDEFIEIHHVESMEVSGSESSDDDAKSHISSAEEDLEEEQEQADKPNDSMVNSTEESDDDYLDVEMEEIQDDSS